MKLRITVVCSLIVMLGSVFLVGCSNSGPKTVITGSVTAVNPKSKKKEPVPFGTITFINTQTQTRATATIIDGKFKVDDAQLGSNKVTVATTPPIAEEIDPDGATNPSTSNKKWFPLPNRYSSEEKTLLTAMVKDGTQSLDFYLK